MKKKRISASFFISLCWEPAQRVAGDTNGKSVEQKEVLALQC